MNEKITQRVIQMANDIIESRLTVREIAKQYGLSKSTVHKDLTERLANINKTLYTNVRDLLDYNKSVRHIRGGLSTKKKYLEKKQQI